MFTLDDVGLETESGSHTLAPYSAALLQNNKWFLSSKIVFQEQYKPLSLEIQGTK